MRYSPRAISMKARLTKLNYISDFIVTFMVFPERVNIGIVFLLFFSYFLNFLFTIFDFILFLFYFYFILFYFILVWFCILKIKDFGGDYPFLTSSSLLLALTRSYSLLLALTRSYSLFLVLPLSLRSSYFVAFFGIFKKNILIFSKGKISKQDEHGFNNAVIFKCDLFSIPPQQVFLVSYIFFSTSSTILPFRIFLKTLVLGRKRVNIS
jgi:hypothetical protein